MATPEDRPSRSGAPRQKRSASRRSRLRERNPLLNPLPIAAAAITAFLVTLALLTARLTAGHDPGLSATSKTSKVVRSTSGQGGTVLRTTASGRTIAVPAGSTAAAGKATSAPPLRTHASGSAGSYSEGERDD